jgi:hypothetical protein
MTAPSAVTLTRKFAVHTSALQARFYGRLNLHRHLMEASETAVCEGGQGTKRCGAGEEGALACVAGVHVWRLGQW